MYIYIYLHTHYRLVPIYMVSNRSTTVKRARRHSNGCDLTVKVRKSYAFDLFGQHTIMLYLPHIVIIIIFQKMISNWR